MQAGVTGLDRDDYMEAIGENFASRPKLIDANRQILNAGAEWAADNL
jgi:2-oxoisovalerate ferredoxin oxidoreductase beta subunit